MRLLLVGDVRSYRYEFLLVLSIYTHYIHGLQVFLLTCILLFISAHTTAQSIYVDTAR